MCIVWSKSPRPHIYLLLLLIGAFLSWFFFASEKQTERGTANKPTAVTCAVTAQAAGLNNVPVFGYKIVNIYPHDPDAFTQGLVFVDGYLYEGTGVRGKSSVRKVDLATGKIILTKKLPARFFGEGITVYRNKVLQLTWRAHLGFIYDKNSFKLLGNFKYPTEGWGITHNNHYLIMSDGTSTLHVLDPKTCEEIGRVDVHDKHGPVSRLNELEYIQGLIYANVWQTDLIAMISLETGAVSSWIDLGGLRESASDGQRVDVLNGIAYDDEGDRLFVTGKLWPKLFEIELAMPKR